MVVKLLSNEAGKKYNVEKNEDKISGSLIEIKRKDENKNIISKEFKEKYYEIIKSSPNTIEKLFDKDTDGFYLVKGENSKYIHLNALIGLLKYFSGDKKESEKLLNKIRSQKNKKGNYSLSISSPNKSYVAELFVSLLEFYSGDKDEAKRLLKLQSYNKNKDGLLTSTNNPITVLTFPNAVNGIGEIIQGNTTKGKEILKKLEKNMPKNSNGVLYVSNDIKKIYLDSVLVVGALKLLVEGVKESEEYIKNAQDTHFINLEGELLEVLYAYLLKNKLSEKN
ncbi:MAG: hypothetical protein QXD23_03085 [Candidatus Micrarchaeaceae archaeon]